MHTCLTLLHSEMPKLWSFGHSECNRVKAGLVWFLKVKLRYEHFKSVYFLLPMALLHSKKSKLHRVLAILSEIGLRTTIAHAYLSVYEACIFIT